MKMIKYNQKYLYVSLFLIIFASANKIVYNQKHYQIWNLPRNL